MRRFTAADHPGSIREYRTVTIALRMSLRTFDRAQRPQRTPRSPSLRRSSSSVWWSLYPLCLFLSWFPRDSRWMVLALRYVDRIHDRNYLSLAMTVDDKCANVHN